MGLNSFQMQLKCRQIMTEPRNLGRCAEAFFVLPDLPYVITGILKERDSECVYVYLH